MFHADKMTSADEPPDRKWENWFLRGEWKFRVIFSHAPPPNSPLPHNKVSSYEGNKVFYTASAVSTLLLFLIFPAHQHTTQSTAFPNAFRGCLLMPWNMVNKSKNNSTRRGLHTSVSAAVYTPASENKKGVCFERYKFTHWCAWALNKQDASICFVSVRRSRNHLEE